MLFQSCVVAHSLAPTASRCCMRASPRVAAVTKCRCYIPQSDSAEAAKEPVAFLNDPDMEPIVQVFAKWYMDVPVAIYNQSKNGSSTLIVRSVLMEYCKTPAALADFIKTMLGLPAEQQICMKWSDKSRPEGGDLFDVVPEWPMELQLIKAHSWSIWLV